MPNPIDSHADSRASKTRSGRCDYSHGGAELVDSVRPLWERLNAHHLANATDFADHYRSATFEGRKTQWLGKTLRVSLCRDGADPVGFCVGSIADGAGEIESLYVLPEYRGSGIGEALARDVVEWCESNGAAAMQVRVAAGNEAAHGFYRRLGFAPRFALLVKR
jgi:diamine N-acetyltransferase